MIDTTEIKKRYPLLAVAQRAGVELRQQGREWWGCCPFHAENTASFSIKADSGEWHCFGCGRGGDVIAFVSTLHRTDFKGAMRILGGLADNPDYQRTAIAPKSSMPAAPADNREKLARDLAGKQVFADDSPGADYLRGRGLPHLLPFLCDVAYHPAWKPWPLKPAAGDWQKYADARAVLFPMRDLSGEVVAVDGRYLNPSKDEGQPKIKTSGQKNAGAFATPNALDGERVVIVESAINALSLALCCVPAVATCGAGNHPAWLIDHCAGKLVYTAYDPDAGGEAGTQQLVADLRAVGARLRWIKPPVDGMDWNDCLVRYGRVAMTVGLADAFGKPLGGVELARVTRR